MRLIADELQDHFLNDTGEPRARWAYKASDADTPEAWRRHRDRARQIAPRIAEDLARFTRDLNVVLSHAVWRVFEIALSEYRRTLAAHAVVDFPDALWRTLELLAQMDEFAQSRYLLQARYHHLLVDEFQDTSQAQWELVWRLVQAWGEGLGMEQDAPLPPSIFIVGDRKQSIYGFRDADVAVLSRAVVSIAGLRAGRRLSGMRSARASARYRGCLPSPTICSTPWRRQERPDAFALRRVGSVPGGGAASTGETRPGARGRAGSPRCAERVASEIEALLASGQVRDRQSGLARAVRPGDIGILFRSREGHQVFESALDARGIGLVRLQRAWVLRGGRDQGCLRAAPVSGGSRIQPARRGIPAIAVRAALRCGPPAARAGVCRARFETVASSRQRRSSPRTMQCLRVPARRAPSGCRW